jgi:hypothetical protein
MTLYVKVDHHGQVYFALSCNSCGVPLVCFDDACYDLASLRAAAVFAGWDAGQRPGDAHRCPSCVRTSDHDPPLLEADGGRQQWMPQHGQAGFSRAQPRNSGGQHER